MSMRRSRLLAIAFSLVALGIAAGVIHWLFATQAPVGQKTAAGKARQSAASGVPVITQVVGVEDFPIRRRTIGILESPASVIIRSRIDSQVLEQHVTDGEIVKKDALLFTLDDREIKATIARDEATIAKDQRPLRKPTPRCTARRS